MCGLRLWLNLSLCLAVRVQVRLTLRLKLDLFGGSFRHSQLFISGKCLWLKRGIVIFSYCDSSRIGCSSKWQKRSIKSSSGNQIARVNNRYGCEDKEFWIFRTSIRCMAIKGFISTTNGIRVHGIEVCTSDQKLSSICIRCLGIPTSGHRSFTANVKPEIVAVLLSLQRALMHIRGFLLYSSTHIFWCVWVKCRFLRF